MRIKALRTIISLIFVFLLAFPVLSAANDGGRGGGRRTVVVQSYYPFWGGYGWHDPFWGGYYGPTYFPIDTRGKIKIKDFNDFDQVYVNGAYAGTVDDVGSLRLEPGKYNIQIRKQGRPIVDREVYVVSGKTVKIVGNEKD